MKAYPDGPSSVPVWLGPFLSSYPAIKTRQNERGQPIGQCSVGFGIRRPDVGDRAIVYPKSVGETRGHSRANDDGAIG
jgi:hypothetical protein